MKINKKKLAAGAAVVLSLSLCIYALNQHQTGENKDTNRVSYVDGKQDTQKTETQTPEQVSKKEDIQAEQIVVKITDQGYVTSHGDHFHYYNGKVPFDAIFSEELLMKDANYQLKDADIVNEVKGGYIIKVDGKYYVSFVVDVPAENIQIPEPSAYAVGVDLGLNRLAVAVNSEGERVFFENPRPLKKAAARLATLQRQLSRKKRGSNRYEKQRIRLAKAHAKVRNTRSHYAHQVANKVVDENQVIALENLNVAGLSRTRLGKSVLDASWGLLRRLIEEKADERHRMVVFADRFAPTSQLCSVCGEPGGRKPLNIREWACTKCGMRLDRDANACVNIMLAAGLAESLNEQKRDVRRLLAGAVAVDAVNPPRAAYL